MSGVPKDEIAAVFSAPRRCCTWSPFVDRKPSQLSGGQRQRCHRRAIVREAAVFLFDEPLSNLDAKLRAELRRELKLLHQQLGNTMVYVTHDQVEAMTLASRIVVMKSGVIQQIGTPTEGLASGQPISSWRASGRAVDQPRAGHREPEGRRRAARRRLARAPAGRWPAGRPGGGVSACGLSM